jgi:predicted small secreted protein
MSAARNALYLFIVMTALAIAACQPSEGPAERSGKAAEDRAAGELGQPVQHAGAKAQDAAEQAADAVTK